jgi:hypothetical protein
MLKGSKDTWTNPHCLDAEDTPAAFLRFKSTREQVALPYSSLIKLALKTDETALELSFVTHQVTISGKNLSEIYKAVADVKARLVCVAPTGFSDEVSLPGHKSLIWGIRIDPLDVGERRRR